MVKEKYLSLEAPVRRATATSRRRLVAAAVAAPLVVALTCGSAAPALAAGHKPQSKDPLAAVRAKALADLTVYGKRLAVVLNAGAGSALLSSDEVLGLHDAGVLQGVALRDDRVAVARARSRQAVAAAVAAGSRTLRVAALELSVSLAAETHLAPATDLSDAMAGLADDATTAAAAGDDTSDLTDALDDVAIDLESAQGDESSAVSDVMSLDNVATVAALAAAAADAVDDLATIDQDISDATDDLGTAQDAEDALSSDGTDPGDGGTDPGDGS